VSKVIYYITSSGENPVKNFIESLEKKDKAKIFRIFQNIEGYGLLSVLPHVKKLVGTPFWEIRILGQNNIRIIYITYTQESIFVLHGFLKKTQKTPNKELDIALNRFKDYQIRP
jgi:phage-related protein